VNNFARLIPLFAADHDSNRVSHSEPPAHFSSSISIFTPATLPNAVGQILSNRKIILAMTARNVLKPPPTIQAPG
jgi:hypothetical protein